MTGEEFKAAQEHAGEHSNLADTAVSHGDDHRVKVGERWLFEVIPASSGNPKNVVPDFGGMGDYLKAHLSFMESIAHSLLAINENLRLLRERP